MSVSRSKALEAFSEARGSAVAGCRESFRICPVTECTRCWEMVPGPEIFLFWGLMG